MKSIHELAESFNKRSAVFMDEGRRTLLDISEGASQMIRKFDPQARRPHRAGGTARRPRRGQGADATAHDRAAR